MMGWYNQTNVWMVVMMLTWPLLIAAAVWAVVALTRGTTPRRSERTPRQILDERLATGEIDPDAHRRTRSLLDNQGMTHPAPARPE